MAESNIKQSIDKLIIGNDMLHIPSKQMRKLLENMVDRGGTGTVDDQAVVRLMYGQDYNNDFNNDFNN